MNCNCRLEMENAASERIQSDLNIAEDQCFDGDLAGYSVIIVDNHPLVAMGAQYSYSYHSKGKTKKGKKTLVFNFCPFCGVKINYED